MDCVFELISRMYIKGRILEESEGLFSKRERAEEVRGQLEKYNPNKKYGILYRRVN